jgi:glycosyltransferase involved in cell wall biosynthesis
MHSSSSLAPMSHRRSHICFVAPNAFPLLASLEDVELVGGAELQQVIVARSLVERGYRISMICLDFGQEDQSEIDGIRVFRAFRPDEGLPVIRFMWPRLTSLWGCMTRVNADIYYQRAAGMLTGLVAAFCKRNNRKSVFAAAGDAKIYYQRDRWIYEYGVRNVDHILVQNEAQAQLFQKRFGRDSTLIPNCYRLPAKRQVRAANEILWVSTIRALKRPHLFLDLAESLPQHQFTMVGGPGKGAASLFESIRVRAATLSNVRFTGFVPYNKIDNYFDAAAAFVNTSETEGFPNTFLQAWARGVPTVAFVDCGARWNGSAPGRLVGSADQLASAIAEFMSDETLRSAEGENCRRYFESNHSIDHVLDVYRQFFDNSCGA